MRVAVLIAAWLTDACPRAVVAEVVLERDVGREGVEVAGGLLAVHPDLVDVVAFDQVAVRIRRRLHAGSQAVCHDMISHISHHIL